MKLVGRTWIPDDDRFFPPYFEHCGVFEYRNLLTAPSAWRVNHAA